MVDWSRLSGSDEVDTDRSRRFLYSWYLFLTRVWIVHTVMFCTLMIHFSSIPLLWMVLLIPVSFILPLGILRWMRREFVDLPKTYEPFLVKFLHLSAGDFISILIAIPLSSLNLIIVARFVIFDYYKSEVVSVVFYTALLLLILLILAIIVDALIEWWKDWYRFRYRRLELW